MATALVSLPPRPSVVMLPSSSTPWKPATTAMVPAPTVSITRVASMALMRALVKALSVSTLSWWPRKLRALPPMAWMAIAVSAAVTCSPVAASASTSRLSGSEVRSLASLRRRLVSPDMALTMTTTSFPAAWAASARAATFLMRSSVPTDVPPNFWTMRATGYRRSA